MKNFIRLFVVVAVLVCAPLALIWSINTLFPVEITYGAPQWLAALFILSCIRGRWLRRDGK